MDAIPEGLLKYGALGLGLGLAWFMAKLLSQHLASPTPKPSHIKAIQWFISAAVVFFLIGSVLELVKDARTKVALEAENDRLRNTVRQISETNWQWRANGAGSQHAYKCELENRTFQQPFRGFSCDSGDGMLANQGTCEQNRGRERSAICGYLNTGEAVGRLLRGALTHTPP